jgi:hypothetical protein
MFPTAVLHFLRAVDLKNWSSHGLVCIVRLQCRANHLLIDNTYGFLQLESGQEKIEVEKHGRAGFRNLSEKKSQIH